VGSLNASRQICIKNFTLELISERNPNDPKILLFVYRRRAHLSLYELMEPLLKISRPNTQYCRQCISVPISLPTKSTLLSQRQLQIVEQVEVAITYPSGFHLMRGIWYCTHVNYDERGLTKYMYTYQPSSTAYSKALAGLLMSPLGSRYLYRVLMTDCRRSGPNL